jgi:hypothetical protein
MLDAAWRLFAFEPELRAQAIRQWTESHPEPAPIARGAPPTSEYRAFRQAVGL